MDYLTAILERVKRHGWFDGDAFARSMAVSEQLREGRRLTDECQRRVDELESRVWTLLEERDEAEGVTGPRAATLRYRLPKHAIAFVGPGAGPCVWCGDATGVGAVGWCCGEEPGPVCAICLAGANPHLGALLAMVGFMRQCARREVEEGEEEWELASELLEMSRLYARATARAWPPRPPGLSVLVQEARELAGEDHKGFWPSSLADQAVGEAELEPPPAPPPKRERPRKDSKPYRDLDRWLELVHDLQQATPADDAEGRQRLADLVEGIGDVRLSIRQARSKMAEGILAGRRILREIGATPPGMRRRYTRVESPASPHPYTIEFLDTEPGPCIGCGTEVPRGPTGWSHRPEPGPLCDACFTDRCVPLNIVLVLADIMRDLGSVECEGKEQRGIMAMLLFSGRSYEDWGLWQWDPFPAMKRLELERFLGGLADRDGSAKGDESASVGVSH